MALKNVKHESFCQEYHISGNKTQAYKKSHPAAENWKDVTINKRASELSLTREVLGRIAELRNNATRSHGITIATLIKELDEARSVALSAETPQTSPAIAATMHKAKLVGLDKPLLDSIDDKPIGRVEVNIIAAD